MAINKKLIHFKSKLKFEEELAKGNILDTSIVFIKETTEIYTHGSIYDGSTFDPSDIEASIENIINNKQDTIEDLDSIREAALSALLEIPEEYITELELAETLDNKIFMGTIDEYNTARSEGRIPAGALVIILEPDELDKVVTSLLGTAIIGRMLLGTK